MKKQNNSDVSSNTTKSQKTRETEERAVESSFRGVRKSTNQTILLVLFMSLGFSLLFFCGGNLRYEGYKDGTRPFFVNLLDALPNIVDAVFFVSISTFLVKTFMNIEMIRPIHDKEDNAPHSPFENSGLSWLGNMLWYDIYMRTTYLLNW